MNKTIVKVFLVIGILVLCLIIWAFVFGGGIANVYGSIKEQVDGVWGNIVGDPDAEILPEWEEDDSKNDLAEPAVGPGGNRQLK